MGKSGGDRRFTALVIRALDAGPRWGSSRALLGSAGAVVAVLAVTGVVALSTTGSAGAGIRDTAATTTAKPHYLLPIAALVEQGAVPPPTLSGDTGSVGVPAGTAPRPTKAPATAPDQGGSSITTYRGATGTMTPVGIATLALQRGCSPAQAPVATAVAMAESGGSPSAQGDVTLMTPVWDWSAGLWQIRGLRAERGTGGLRDSVANQRATTNAAAMYVISSGCTNWSAWTTYTRGLYAGYLGVARQAVDYAVAYRAKHGRYPTVAAPDPNAVIPVSTGGGAAAPASVPSSTSVRATKPKTGKTPAASPTPGGGAEPSTAAPRPGTGSSTSRRATTTPKPSPTSKKSTSTKPLIPLPTLTVPVISLPVLPPITLPPIHLP